MANFTEINDATGFANGEQFVSAEQVRAYFTVEAQREMFGAEAASEHSQDTLDEWAELVIATRWHCAF